jgi:negative regulator of flagellin synthesis FlgM
MPIDINGLPRSQPADSQGTRAPAKGKDTATGAAPATDNTDAAKRSETARQLTALKESLGQVPVVDSARVDAVRQSLEKGEYQVDAEKIAQKLLDMERGLGRRN